MPPLLNSRRYIGASILCLVAVRHAASVSAPNKEEIPHATAEAHTAEARLAFSNGQRVAAAVDLTGQAHAMAEFKDSGRATITTTVVSSDENVDCLWDTWVDWSVCQFSCGGESVRTRKVKVMATGNGAACDTNDRETRVCNKNPCPLDCMWDEWSPWGVCSVTCGLGTKTKTREKKQYQQYGGATCVGHWSLATDCEERVCAVDCKWSDWGDWEGCSKSCGTGASSRYRTYAQVKNAFGEDCTGENFQTEKCGMNSCPVDCVMEDWGAWEPCDVTCGTGATRRSRKVLTHPTYGGETCGPTTEEGTCHNGLCPVHCEVSDWSQWSDCSLTCSSENSIGVSKRTRKVVQDNNALGNACDGDLEQTIGCSRMQCPVDCKLSEWSQWSECSTSCGPGISERERSMSTPAQYGGRDCAEESYQKKYCTSDICPVDCQWADWQDWRGCSTTCANGTSYRMRLVQTPMLHGGRECAGGSQQNRACNAAFCPIHCQWDEWTQWSQCSTTCGDGSLSRSREIKVHPLYGGNACNGTSTDTTSCDQAGCPVQCQWSEWSAYGSCTSSCGTGQHSRTREKTVLAQNGGADCTGDGKETEACPDLPACPVDCEWDDWSQWESCSTTCGKGSMKRSRIRKVYEKDGGHTCYGYEDDEKVCESDPCPVDCLLGSWTKWSECSSSCGGGVELRTRQILVVAAHGGVACNTSDLLQSTACEEVPCPIHCVWGHWSEWSTCTKECEGGVTYRHRSEVIVAEYGGKQCEGSADEEMVCNAHGCPVDCKFGDWSEWSDCSKSCDSGNRTAGRPLITAPQWGGQPCDGGIMKSEYCNEQPCPEDCTWGDWSHYSVCSKTCGGGEMLRTRPRIGQMYGGSPCDGNDTDSTPCNTRGCPQDCEWGPWSAWTGCSKECGGGSIKRFREVIVEKDFGGDPCFGSNAQEAGCNFDVCTINCEWNDWELWSPCSKSCNGGTRTKLRNKKWESSNGGLPCLGNATDMEKCNTDPCPVDCTFELWESWGECSTSCGMGSRFRTRVKKEELYGGAPCQDVMWEVGECNNPESPNCPKPTTSTTTSLAVLQLPEGQLAWSHLHNVWEPQASRGPLAVPSHEVLSKTFTESKDPSYKGKAYKPCKAGELNKTLEAFESMKKQGGDLNASEADAVKVIDELISNMSGAAPDAQNLGLDAAQAAKAFDINNLTVVAKSQPDTDSSKDFADAFEASANKLKDGKDVVAEVAGDLGLDVIEADEFVANKNVTVAMEKAIAVLAGAKASDVKVDITIPQGMLLSTWQRKVKGNVNVAYMVEVYKQDENKGNASLLASRISSSDIDTVTTEVRDQVLGQGLTFTLRAVSLSVTVLPVTTDGNIDVLGASVDALTNASIEDAVPTAVTDGKAKATTEGAMVETAQKQAKLHSPVSKEQRRKLETLPSSIEEQGAEGAKSAARHLAIGSIGVREVKMPCVILGTAGQRGLQGKRGRAAILNALKMGYRGIDTSEMNRNLFDVGWACKASTLERRELFLTMKIPPWSHGYEATKSSFARQLQQLQSDYVDLLLVQWPHVWRQEQKEWGPMQWRRVNQWQAGQLQGTWAAMEEICKSGKAKAIGVSNYTMQHMEALLKYCTVRPAVLQGESHPHWPNRSLRDWCRKHDIAFQGYAPFGGQETPENSGHRPVDDAFLKKVAECNGLSNFQVCMQWNQSRNSSTVVQSQDKKHLRENLTACNVNLCSATDFKGIDENAKEHSQYGPCYWGDNDKDNLNIWKDEEKLLEAVLPEPRGHHWSPKAKTPEEMRKEGWEPLVPPEALPPAKREGNR